MLDAADERVLKAWRDWKTILELNEVVRADAFAPGAVPVADRGVKKDAVAALHLRCRKELYDAIDALTALTKRAG